LLATAPFASAHTWIEQMMVIAPNGTLVGDPGFARGNVLRDSAGFSDPTMVNLIPPDGRPINEIDPTDLMCKSTQTTQTQTDGSPRLQAAAGSGIALRYQENGHVTLPQNQPGKPTNRGTVYVYGTTQPSSDDAFLAIHRVWNADGTGGDGRGVLLSTQNFDDGQCYQVNGGTISEQRQQTYAHPADTLMGSDLWCQQDIQIPSTAPSGQPYTLYWVWDWPTLPGTSGFPDGKQEIYTTCMDVDIVDGAETLSADQVSYVAGQPLDNAAVSAELADIANPTAVTGKTIPFTAATTTSVLTSSDASTIAFSASATGPASGAASEASVSAASAATETSTGVPGFLSVHTGSTAGPGIETQTFSVMPISITASDAPEPQQTGEGHGHGNGNVLVATFTSYESVTETVYQTVYQTQYTKRDGEFSFPFPSRPNPLDAPAINAPPAQSGFAPGEPHSVFRGGGSHRHHNHSCGFEPGSGGRGPRGSGNGNSTGVASGYCPSTPSSYDGDGQSTITATGAAAATTTTSDMTATTIGPLTTLSDGVVLTMPTPGGSIMTMPDGSIMTMPVSTTAATTVVVMATHTTTTTTTALPESSLFAAVSSFASAFSTLLTPSSALQSSESDLLTVVPVSGTAPAPTQAPAMNLPVSEGDLSSTAHAAFRLRARNPFHLFA
jgi:hypothetical protein